MKFGYPPNLPRQAYSTGYLPHGTGKATEW